MYNSGIKMIFIINYLNKLTAVLKYVYISDIKLTFQFIHQYFGILPGYHMDVGVVLELVYFFYLFSIHELVNKSGKFFRRLRHV